jgi:hypothetical protein
MDVKTIPSWLVAATVLLGLASLSGLPAESKKWTTDQRQTKLMQDINAGQKSGELTLKESNKLRRDLSQVARYKAKLKFKGQSNRKLTSDEEAELEQQINKISTEIHKDKLEKRVQSH